MIERPKLAASVVLALLVGLVSAYLTAINQSVPISYFQVLAIVQASLLGIIIAIYILSSQLAANQYSIRLLSIHQGDNTFAVVIGLFGISILLDIFGILSNAIIVGVISSISVAITSTFAVGAFSSLYLIKDSLIERTQPETIADRIRANVTPENLRSEIGKSRLRPYLAYFEAARAAIESGDNQAARQIVTALSDKVTASLNEILEADSASNDELILASKQIINDLEDILDKLVESENTLLIQQVSTNIFKSGKTALESDLDTVGSSAGYTLFKIGDLVLLWDDIESVSKFPWGAFGKLLGIASEKQLEETIRTLTLANSNLLLTIEEEHSFERSFQLRIANILVEGYLNAWKRYISHSGAQISPDDILIGDPEFMELGEFENLYNYYENGYKSIGRVLAKLVCGSGALSPGSFQLAKTTIEGLSDVAIVAGNEDNKSLAKHIVKLTIMTGIGLDQQNSKFVDLPSVMTDIRDSNAKNAEAVNSAFTELQNLKHQGMNNQHWHLSLLMYRYDDDENVIAEFENNVAELYNKMSD